MAEQVEAWKVKKALQTIKEKEDELTEMTEGLESWEIIEYNNGKIMGMKRAREFIQKKLRQE